MTSRRRSGVTAVTGFGRLRAISHSSKLTSSGATPMQTKWSFRRAGPLLLLGSGIVLVLVTSLPGPNPVIDLGPADLRLGANRNASFNAGYDELYAIGLQMDQRVTISLFPCTADPASLSLNRAACERPEVRVWPVALSFALSADGHDISRSIRMSSAAAGGEYSGSTFTWQPAYVELQRGKEYRLTVHSLRNGSALDPARPRLVMGVVTPGFLEERMLRRMAALVSGAVLVIGGLVWGAARWLPDRRAAKSRA